MLASIMRLFINGEERELPAGLTLSALLAQLGMKPDRVAVERNRDIVRRERWEETTLEEGDRLEIVHFVGGGAGEWPDGRIAELPKEPSADSVRNSAQVWQGDRARASGLHSS
jgi:sulfur carrier protein